MFSRFKTALKQVLKGPLSIILVRLVSLSFTAAYLASWFLHA